MQTKPWKFGSYTIFCEKNKKNKMKKQKYLFYLEGQGQTLKCEK